MEEKVVQPITRIPVASPTPQVIVIKTNETQPAEPTQPEAKEPVDGGQLAPQDHYLTSPTFYEVCSFFGVEQQEYEQAKNKLSTIVDWAAEEAQSGNVEDILTKIRELEDRLQPPQWGERRYQNVYKYVRLAGKRQALDKALGAFERMPQRR